MHILCVAEKPSIARALAHALGGGNISSRTSRNKYIKNFDVSFNFRQWGPCEVTVTSVMGHLSDMSFLPPHDNWNSPPEDLFNAAVQVTVPPNNRTVAENISKEARTAKYLYIWTDCDREGEHIGHEIASQAVKGNRSIKVVRASFNNVDASHMRDAAQNPQNLDQRLVAAVETRQELDLRTGFAFTRFQTDLLRSGIPELRSENQVISYGACQFPTLGFVVDRWLEHKKHIPEKFWYIDLAIRANSQKESERVLLKWERGRLFDHPSVVLLYERCLEEGGKTAIVRHATRRPTSHQRPLPLTTVQLQKQGSKYLRMTSKAIMDHAEKLYNSGFISYPRTETDSYDDAIDVKGLVAKQQSHPVWGGYASALKNGAFVLPRKGKNNDKAHPPIHPIRAATPDAVGGPIPYSVYEFITRHFLATCSDDAKGLLSTVQIDYGEEQFHASGIVVTARNFLDVYPYDKWSSNALPDFTSGQELAVISCMMREGKTTAPPLLTESELIALMDANGIGTDATMSDHIQKIKTRNFITEERKYLFPTTLGVALVNSYDAMDLETSLTKPDLRRQTEEKVSAIAAGLVSKQETLRGLIKEYENVFRKVTEKKQTLISVSRSHILGSHNS